MQEIEFSIIGEYNPVLRKLVEKFEQASEVRVKILELSWETAWHEMLLWTLYGKGPDVSHVGSTWAGSLMGMDALRPITQADVQYIGGSQAFLPQSWASCDANGAGEACSLPWTAFTFVLAYHRDMLQQANVDETAAFQDADSLLHTVRALEKAGVAHPWVVPVSPDHIDTLHHVAAWIWSAGGDFLTPDNRHVDFMSPATIDAIGKYFDLLRYSGPIDLPLTEEGSNQLFLDGKSAITIMGMGYAYTWMQEIIDSSLADNIGFAAIPGIPWVGGDNLVIWKNARMTSERERIAVSFARYLASLPAQREYIRGGGDHLPAMVAALEELPMQGSALTKAIVTSLQNGRAYRPMTVWSKIETRFSQVLGNIGTDIIHGAGTEATVRRQLEALANWLEIILR